MNKTTENFWEAWALPVDPPAPIFYRLYYNEQGWPICYSMEDLPGNYIDLDAITYQLGPTNARVVDGKLTLVKPPVTILKLIPNQLDGITCDPRDVTVIVDPTQAHTKWSVKAYEA